MIINRTRDRFISGLCGCICGFSGGFLGAGIGAAVVSDAIWQLTTDETLGAAIILGGVGGILGMGLKSARWPKLNGYHGYTGFIGAALLAGIYAYVEIGWVFALYIGIGAGVGGGNGGVWGYRLSKRVFPHKNYIMPEEYYSIQYQLMRESVEKMQSIRHDMKSHLSTIKTYSASGNQEDIVFYLNYLLEDMKESELYSNTGNMAIDSIVNYKLRSVKTDDVKLDLKILVPAVLHVETVDIVTIIGNILDNALEAVSKVDDKVINLNIALNNGALLIKSENTFNGEVKYQRGKMGKNNEMEIYSLKPGHGYGLKNIKRAVDKYDGYLDIAHSNNIFSVRILLSFDMSVTYNREIT